LLEYTGHTRLKPGRRVILDVRRIYAFLGGVWCSGNENNVIIRSYRP
jgi:hypothetical protein